MKTAEEWIKLLTKRISGACINNADYDEVITSMDANDIRAIQADALRHAAMMLCNSKQPAINVMMDIRGLAAQLEKEGNV